MKVTDEEKHAGKTIEIAENPRVGSEVPPDLHVLQLAFKRAAWYSLTLTAIVTVVGERRYIPF